MVARVTILPSLGLQQCLHNRSVQTRLGRRGQMHQGHGQAKCQVLPLGGRIRKRGISLLRRGGKQPGRRKGERHKLWAQAELEFRIQTQVRLRALLPPTPQAMTVAQNGLRMTLDLLIPPYQGQYRTSLHQRIRSTNHMAGHRQCDTLLFVLCTVQTYWCTYY